MSVVEKHARHFEKANADSGRLPVTERLGANEQRARHRPFTRSTIVCSFHVRDLKIVSSRFCSLATSEYNAKFVLSISASADRFSANVVSISAIRATAV